jgi:membrane protease subunit HflC
MGNRSFVVGFVLVLLGLLGMNSLYVVTELERAILLEFGRVVNDDIKPGLHVKLPIINEVRKFDGRVRTPSDSKDLFGFIPN